MTDLFIRRRFVFSYTPRVRTVMTKTNQGSIDKISHLHWTLVTRFKHQRVLGSEVAFCDHYRWTVKPLSI